MYICTLFLNHLFMFRNNVPCDIQLYPLMLFYTFSGSKILPLKDVCEVFRKPVL